MSSLDEIKERLKAYKKKYYIRQTLVGILSFAILNISVFLFLGYIEYKLWMASIARSILFFTFLALSLCSLYVLVIQHLLKMINLKKGIEDQEAAFGIASFFPEIEDRLLNLLQLGKQTAADNALINTAINKKADDFKQLSFVKAVDFSAVKNYIGMLALVITCLFMVSFIHPEIIMDSSKRIVNYNKEFERTAPFQFEIINDKLEIFKGEDFTLQLKIKGNLLPEKVNLLIDDKIRTPLSGNDKGIFSYTFERLQEDKEIQFEASGYFSQHYRIKLYERPDLLLMNILIQPPDYTGEEHQQISNTGDLSIMEGSSVKWTIDVLATKNAYIKLNKDTFQINRIAQNQFVFEKRIFSSGTYDLFLHNNHSTNKSDLQYNIKVIKDQFPKIQVVFSPDSSSYQHIMMAGSISDDYGCSKLTLNYRKDDAPNFAKIPLEITPDIVNENFYINWNIDTLGLNAGDKLELHLTVTDNDGVNGPKVSKSKSFTLQIPTKEKIGKMIGIKSKSVENLLEHTKEETETISEKISEVQDRLKSKQKFDWQEKRLIEEMIQDRKRLDRKIEELQKKHEDLQIFHHQFRKQSPQLQEKNQKMQELLDELMDEETRKLYEKLKELMKENKSQDQIIQQLQQLKRNETNLERDLERILELFKRLKMESELEQNVQKLDLLSKEQEVLANQNVSETKQEDLEEQQKEIQKKFDEFRKNMDKVMEMNQELKRPEAMGTFEYEEKQISKALREIIEEMEKISEDPNSEKQHQQDKKNAQNEGKQNQQKEIQKKQNNASQKMKGLKQKLSNMKDGMQMEVMQANLDQLRDILDNLVKLSFNQEDIMKEMKEINPSNPRFLELSQDQLKLKDDAKVVQDSLLSLASKVVQISSYVTKQVNKVNENIDKTIDFLKDRKRGKVFVNQQFAMTAINNLALLLDNTIQQMQMMMAEAMGNGSGEKQQSKGLPDMQKLQNELGEKINELKGSGKTGRELSEQLAKMAAEQEAIRRQMEWLKKIEDGKLGGGSGGDNLKKAIDMMEQNEVDLVNKRLTQQLIDRQKQIQTRMLEAEKAQKEQEIEEERKAERPMAISREIPPEFEEYLKQKQKETELLKTIPIELNPFYKREVNDYFRRISTKEPK